MLSARNFAESHIRELQGRLRRDPALLERSVHAFGLLEALAGTGLPFIFKGGTCLMLLLGRPRRLSTDIDIVVSPGVEVEPYLERAARRFPFLSYSEQERAKRGSIAKRHFKFEYASPVFKRPLRILLDVLFEENQYAEVCRKEIEGDLLITEGEPVFVTMPTPNCILGDKLTAFAPHTTGIPLNVGKDLEVMKQFYDVHSLLDVFDDFRVVSSVYDEIVRTEISYRGAPLTREDCLFDTFVSSLCIASRGEMGREEYPLYVRAIREFGGHVLYQSYSAEIASFMAPKLMCAALCLLLGRQFERVEEPGSFADKAIRCEALLPLRHLKKRSQEAYAYAVTADGLLGELLQSGVKLPDPWKR